MMPLSLGSFDKEYIVRKIIGTDEEKLHLNNLGFAIGDRVVIIACMDGDIIVKIKETRIAISRELAEKILV